MERGGAVASGEEEQRSGANARHTASGAKHSLRRHMSFSSDVKSELCRGAEDRKCCAVAESYGILLYCNTFSVREIRIVTGTRPLAVRLPGLFKSAFGLEFDMLPENTGNPGKLTYIITSPEKLNKIFETYGYERDSLIAHQVNLGVLEDDCCRQSFIRGAFLAGGSVTDPVKQYHLELVTDHYNVSRQMFALLIEMEFEPKEASRNGNFITYFKQSEAIENLLTTIGAPISAMKLMSAKIEKDMRNSINRQVNCDTANVSKTVNAAQQQISAIQRIITVTGLEALPDKLKETAQLRLEYPELSLSELALTLNPPVTKSCLNHRMRKLMGLAEKLG